MLHYRLARRLKRTRLSAGASAADQEALEGAIGLGMVGHVTSAEKNFVLTAVAFFFVLQGTGPMSLGDAQGVISGNVP